MVLFNVSLLDMLLFNVSLLDMSTIVNLTEF